MSWIIVSQRSIDPVVLLHLRDDLRIGQLVRGLDCNNTLRQRPSADFFTTEVWTWRGLVTYDTAFVIDLASRRVRIVGSTPRHQRGVHAPSRSHAYRCHRTIAEFYWREA